MQCEVRSVSQAGSCSNDYGDDDDDHDGDDKATYFNK